MKGDLSTYSIKQVLDELMAAELPEFVTKLHEPVFTASQIPLTQRIISTWHEKDLFLYKREIGQWRRFSMADYIWVLLLIRLREWGIGLDVIKQVRDVCVESTFDLFEKEVVLEIMQLEPGVIRGDLEEAISLFENRGQLQEQLALPQFQKFSLWLNLVISENVDVLLRIIPGRKPVADFVILNAESDYQRIVQSIADKGGVFIGFQSLLTAFYQDDKLKWEEAVPLELSKQEKHIIGILREKNLKRVVVKVVGEKPVRVEKHHQQKNMTTTELTNMLAVGKYISTEITKQTEDTLYVNLIEKVKL
jgi:DNA-binding transcriptional MerR regulator